MYYTGRDCSTENYGVFQNKLAYMGRGMTEKFDFFWNLRSNCAKGAERIDSKQASISKAMFINLVVI